MRKKQNQMSKKETAAILEAFNEAAGTFPGPDGAVQFTQNVLTEGEKIIIGRRILIAQMILRGQTYYEINEKLNISPNTFSKVRKWLTAQLPEYETVLKNEKAQQASKVRERKKTHSAPLSFDSLKKKYPMHFLLFNIFDSSGK